MSRLDLHADGLLDRARLGQLGEEERALLEAHCATCAACRVELQWIEDGLHREAPSVDDRARGAAAVEALLGAGAPPLAKERPRLPLFKAAAMTAAALLIASGAAALYSEVRELRARMAEVHAQDAQAKAESAGKRKRGRAKSAPSEGPSQSPVAVMAPARVSVRVPVPVPAPVPAVVPAPAPAPLPARPPIPAPVPAPVPRPVRLTVADPVTPRLTVPPEVVRARAAESLFRRANAARDAGRYVEAAERYAELSRFYPGARGELAARISRGQLLLQKLGRPADALQAFEDYLHALPGGPLAAEARAGVALSFMQLDRPREERNAWQDLLQRHPDSLHADRARARLATLPR